MRLLIFALLASLAAAPAFAGPGQDLAEMAAPLRAEAAQRAESYTAMPGATIAPVDTDDAFLVDVTEFAAASARLSFDIEHGGGPQDLRCIFRGMAGDAQSRLPRLEQEMTGADAARVYRAYERLFAQAEEIAPLADDPDIEEADGVPPSCPALTAN
tara:strand:- start:433 stop:903 length:471 start_codon:yes stop_codon:yes gene_type:complete